MSCSNISSKCVRNLSRLEAWCGCQLGCQQPGLVLQSSCVIAGTHTHLHMLSSTDVTKPNKTTSGHAEIRKAQYSHSTMQFTKINIHLIVYLVTIEVKIQYKITENTGVHWAGREAKGI